MGSNRIRYGLLTMSAAAAASGLLALAPTAQALAPGSPRDPEQSCSTKPHPGKPRTGKPHDKCADPDKSGSHTQSGDELGRPTQLMSPHRDWVVDGLIIPSVVSK